jgi:CDP-diacylglycerol--glycerol-3-phosphate 3-phosphatidyltransferase
VNIPNALTLSRLVAIPILMALLLLRFPGHDQVAAALFIAFSLTDTLDGQLARRRGSVSNLGKFLDPLADKLFVLSVLIVLVQEGLVAAWVVVVIFSRELIITILRSVAASQGTVIAAAPLGKTKTITQMAAVTLLILQRPYPVLVPVASIAVVVAVAFTLFSGLDYLVRFRRRLSTPAPGQTGGDDAGGASRDSVGRGVVHRRAAGLSFHGRAGQLGLFSRRDRRLRGPGQARPARSSALAAGTPRSRQCPGGGGDGRRRETEARHRLRRVGHVHRGP